MSDFVAALDHGAGLRRASAGDLEGRIGAQGIDVFAILITGRDHHHARQRHVGIGVRHPERVAIIGQRCGDDVGESELRGDLAQHNHAAIGRQPAAVEKSHE